MLTHNVVLQLSSPHPPFKCVITTASTTSLTVVTEAEELLHKNISQVVVNCHKKEIKVRFKFYLSLLLIQIAFITN